MKALLVDGLNLVRRIHAAVPKHRNTETASADSSDDAEHVNGIVRSVSASLQRALKQHQPSHCLIVFEQSGRNWRHRLFPDYKKKRPPVPSDLQLVLSTFEDALLEMGIAHFSLMGYEADDVIATMATKIAKHQGHAIILSTDRNYCQLLQPGIQIYDHFGQRFLDKAMVSQRFGVMPQQVPDLLALAGDSSLSIPGIPSIGKRTAAKLLHDHDTLEQVLSAAESIPGKLGSKLYNGKDDARIAKQLFTLRLDLDLGLNLNQIRYVPAD